MALLLRLSIMNKTLKTKKIQTLLSRWAVLDLGHVREPKSLKNINRGGPGRDQKKESAIEKNEKGIEIVPVAGKKG